MANLTPEALQLSDFIQICRICRKQEGTLINIFFSDAAEVISKITSIQLQEGDCLPENICISCMDKTTEFFQFKLLCEQSDTVFRSILSINGCKSSPTPNIVKIKKEYKRGNNKDKNKSSVIVTNNKTNEKRADDKFNERITNMTSFKEQAQRQTNNIKIENEESIQPLVELENDTSIEMENNEYANKEIKNELNINKIDEKVRCASCQLLFDDLKQKTEHLEKFHPSSNCHLCYLCTKEFSSVYSTINQLRNHLKYHRSSPKFSCDVCDKKFRNNYQKKIHMRLHTGERPATCDICDKSFRDPRYLVMHLKTHTGEKPYNCSVCKKAFSHKFSLKVHMKTHSLERNHMCNLCGKSFIYSHNLKIHARQHTGERPYTCQLCFSSFISGSILSAHMLIHSENKRFSCQKCGKKFKRSGDLTIHMRSHTGEKPYACTICPNRYKMSSHLTEHMKRHTGERNYVCEICFKSFCNNKALQVHKKTHTGGKSYICKFCERSFVHYTSLCAHNRKIHKEGGKES